MPYSDPEKQKEFQKQWQAEHPDKMKEYYQAYEQRDDVKEKRRAYSQSEAGKASLKRRREKYRSSLKNKLREQRYRDAHGRDAYYRFEHGITEAEFEARIAAQNNLCPIGNHPFGERGKNGDSPCQDHNHLTGENRAILCRNHNVMLGLAHDSIAELESAILYLRSFEKSKEENSSAECLDY